MAATGRGTSALALAGGERTVKGRPASWPIIGDQERQWMAEVVDSGKWSWVGIHERAFCDAYRQFNNCGYCAGLSNGTVTIQCALQAVGVVPGDEVIVPGMTWVATAQAAMDIGANVVLVDIDPETLCLDPEALRKAITPKTKAVVPVHLYGCMCDMDAIGEIAKEHGLKIVEDVAHQHGGMWRDKRAGTLGDAGSFSFQQSKILTCGEGGAVICDDPDVYQTIFALKQVGWAPANPSETPYDNLIGANRYGHNYRMTEMQAVLLRGGLSRLEEQNTIRDENAQHIAARLREAGGPLQVARRDPRIRRQAYYALTMVFDPAQSDGVTRNDYMKVLAAEGCPTSGLYSAVYRSPLLNLYDRTSPIPFRDPAQVQNYAELSLPNVEKACAETALLLSHAHLLGTRAYVDELVDAVCKVNDHLGEIEAAVKNQG